MLGHCLLLSLGARTQARGLLAYVRGYWLALTLVFAVDLLSVFGSGHHKFAPGVLAFGVGLVRTIGISSNGVVRTHTMLAAFTVGHLPFLSI